MMLSVLGFLGDLKSFLLGFAWQLCLAAALVLMIASAVPLPRSLQGYSGAARLVAVLLFGLAGEFHGRSVSNEKQRLEEARREIEWLKAEAALKQDAIKRGEEEEARLRSRIDDLTQSVNDYAAELSAEDEARGNACIEPWNARDRERRARWLRDYQTKPRSR